MTIDEKNIIHNFVQQYSIPTEFRVVERINGMRFVIRSKEQGHNDAHVHIEDGNSSFAISLTDFRVLNCSGKVPERKIKMAQNFIRDNRQLFIDNWNEFSNGVKVDLIEGVS